MTKGLLSDAAAEGFYTRLSGKKCPRVRILTVTNLLETKSVTSTPDYEPDLNFEKAKAKDGDEWRGYRHIFLLTRRWRWANLPALLDLSPS